MVALASDTLDQLNDPITDCLTPEVAARVAQVRLDPRVLQRIETLREASDAGTMTETDRAEYLDLVEVLDLIGIVQAKARRVAASRGR